MLRAVIDVFCQQRFQCVNVSDFVSEMVENKNGHGWVGTLWIQKVNLIYF